MQQEYRVSWEIDIIAESGEEAARKALAIHRKPDSIATVFRVVDESGKGYNVDLTEIDENVKPLCEKHTDYGVYRTHDLELWRELVAKWHPEAVTLHDGGSYRSIINGGDDISFWEHVGDEESVGYVGVNREAFEAWENDAETDESHWRDENAS